MKKVSKKELVVKIKKKQAKQVSDKLIIALDEDSMKEAEKIVKLVKGECPNFKVGMPLFTACGPSVVDMIHTHGGKVFLDLKYHDIPSTVGKAVAAAARMGVEMINVHASGGRRMLCEALAAAYDAAPSGRHPLIVAVTVLTSMESLGDIGVQFQVREQVVRLAQLVQDVGLHGVYASPLEISPIRNACGNDFLIIASGIRLKGSHLYDQARIASPKQAVEAGADYIVVGRPITEAADPVKVVREILKEMGA